MKLNLGCGNDIRSGYINIDCRPLEGVDIIGDISDEAFMRGFTNAEEIIAYDVIEHFPRKEARRLLRLWSSLLKPGGLIKIRCPDIRHASSLNMSDENLELLLYGGQDYEQNYHRCGFTLKMLKELLIANRMVIVKAVKMSTGNIEVWARKQS